MNSSDSKLLNSQQNCVNDDTDKMKFYLEPSSVGFKNFPNPERRVPAPVRRAARRGLRLAHEAQPAAAEPDPPNQSGLDYGLGRPTTEIERLAAARFRYRALFGTDAPIEPGALSAAERADRINALIEHASAAIAADRTRILRICAMQPTADRLGYDIRFDSVVKRGTSVARVHLELAAAALAEGVTVAEVASVGVMVLVRGRD